MEPSSNPAVEADASDITPALDLQDAQDGRTAASMDANKSHEDVGMNLRSAAQHLRGQNHGGRAGTQSRGDGKLRRPSSKAMPSSAKVAPMRKLGRPVNTRKSVYDVAGSPEKPTLPPRAVVNPAPFSPLRAQRKAKWTEQQPQAHRSPRRSSRVQGLEEDGADAEAAHTKLSDADVQERATSDADAADDIYRDHFPDHVVQRHFPAEVDAEAGADERPDSGSVDKQGSEKNEREPVQAISMSTSKEGAPEKKKRGRPRKHAKANDANLEWQQHRSSPPMQDLHPESQTPSSVRSQRRLATLRQQNAPVQAPQPDGQTAKHLKQQLDMESEEQPAGQTGASAEKQPDKQSAEQSKKRSNRGPRRSQEPAAKPAPRRSSRHEQAVANVNQRRNAQDNADSARIRGTGNGSADSLGPEQEGEDAEDQLADKPIIPRISEVRFINTTNGGDVSEVAGNDTAEASNTQKRKKRKTASQSTQANTGAKRRKTANPDDDEYEEANEQQPPEERSKANERRLWGQWLPLKRLRRDLKNVGCNTERGELTEQNEIDLEDDDVEEIVGLCTQAMQQYQRLMDGDAEDAEPASVFEDIGRRVDGLRGHNEDFPTDFNDKTKTTNLYSHLIPALVKLIWQAVECYEALDKDDTPAGQISMSHLRNVQALISLTLEMEHSAEKQYKARPDTSNAVVKAVHNGIAVPLRNIFEALHNVIQRHRAEARATQLRQQEAQDRALRLEQEERRSRQEAELTRIRKKWEQLHLERMAVEGGLMRPAKMAHLQMPDPNLDIDANGTLFRRVSIFHPRVGPPPGLLETAKELVWTEGELRALTDGLSVYAGPMVYERLFRAWCPSGRLLNRYNVMEIVAAAENVKAYYEKEFGDAVEEWVKAIPVWSKSHAVGEENEDSFVDVDEIAGDDAVAVATAVASW